MTITAILAIVNALIGTAYNLYTMTKQISGELPIPTWEELVQKNSSLQAKIDAEK